MGKKSWFSAMKKAVSPKNKKEKRSHNSKSNPTNSWNANQVSLDACSSQTEAALANPMPLDHSIMETEFLVPEIEQIKHVDIVTYIVTVAEAKRTTSNSCFLGKTREETSAIKIQAAYRGYMARKAFRSLRAMRRLTLWIQGQAVKRQTASALMRIQTMGRVQSQVRARRIRMAEANETLQRHRIQKRQKVIEKQAFDLSPRSKEQVDASLRHKKQAAERREKALAYAFSRQQAWRNSQLQKPAVVGPNHFDWAWSWSNRWDAIRQWEAGTSTNAAAAAAGAMVRPQSPPALSSGGQRLNKSPTSRVNTGCRVGLANKRHLVMSSRIIVR